MKVRFVIDRIVVEGLELSGPQQAQFERALRTSLEATLLERTLASGHAGLVSGVSGCVHVELPLAAHAGVAGLGQALGPALAATARLSTPEVAGGR
jgi:hypothetical protein